MKKIIISFIFVSLFFSLYIFFFYAKPLEFAIIPKWAISFSAIASFLRMAPGFFIVPIYLFGLLAFSYTIYLFTEIIHNKTKNWWKTGCFSFITAITIIYAFIYSLNFYFYPKMIPTNNLVLGCFIFSTIFLFPLKESKKYIISYIIFLISYFLILETYGNALLVNGNFTLFFAPVYVILLYLLVYNFIKNEILYPYLAILVVFVPIKIIQRNKYKPFYTDKITATYTMIAPSENYYKVENFERPFTSGLTYKNILELDSMIRFEKEQYNSLDYFSLLKSLNLSEKRIGIVKELLNDKNLYIGKIQKEKIGEIIKRWENGNERGIISGKITGETPDKIGLLKYKGISFKWHNGTSIGNIVDAVSPKTNEAFTFRYIPSGKYEIILFYKKRVPHYKGKIPIIESNNDTVQLGNIEIR